MFQHVFVPLSFIFAIALLGFLFPAHSMSNRNFFAELKRRNVYKVAVAYAVAAWLLDPGGIDFVSDLQRPRVGDASRRYHPRARISRGAGFFMGIRNHLRRNCSRIGS